MANDFELIQEEDRLFVKFFLLDDRSNLNDWGVTMQAMKNNIASFIGKPFVLRADFDHPQASSGEELLIVQEADRVGTISKVGIEQNTGKGWGIAEITDPNAREIFSNGEVSFVSPSIVFQDMDLVFENGFEKVSSFEGAHVAGVKEPAYGMQRAQIKGKCSGSEETCDHQLMKVQASITKSADPEEIEKRIKEIDKMIAQLDELEEINKLSPDEQFDRLEDAEETELIERRKNQVDGEPSEDEDPEEVLKERRKDDAFLKNIGVHDDPKIKIDEDAKLQAELQSMQDSKYSVLSYLVASKGVKGDSLMQSIGVSND